MLYIVEKRVSNNTTAASKDKFLLGKDNRGRIGGVYGAAVYDEMEFWEGPRDYLIAFGYIQRGRTFGISFLTSPGRGFSINLLIRSNRTVTPR